MLTASRTWPYVIENRTKPKQPATCVLIQTKPLCEVGHPPRDGRVLLRSREAGQKPVKIDFVWYTCQLEKRDIRRLTS